MLLRVNCTLTQWKDNYFFSWNKPKKNVHVICMLIILIIFPWKRQQRMCPGSLSSFHDLKRSQSQLHQLRWAEERALAAVQFCTSPENQRRKRKHPQRQDDSRWYRSHPQRRPEHRLQPAEDDYWYNPYPNRAQQQGLSRDPCQASPAKQQWKPCTAQHCPICSGMIIGCVEGSWSDTYSVGSIHLAQLMLH